MWRYLLIYLSAIIMLAGCSKDPFADREGSLKEYYQPDQTTKNVKRELDSLVHYYFNRNPDSAIHYSEKLIRYFDSIHCEESIFESCFFLSEIYIYQKPNDYLATYYFSKGLKIMLEHNIDFDINPFLLIDIGNLLFRQKLYQQAIARYRVLVSYSRKIGHKYAEAVAYNNIGLSYQKLMQYDSAVLFVIKSLFLRKTLMPVLEAQNYLNLSKIYLETEHPDSVFYYYNAIQKALDRQVFTAETMVGMKLENAKALADEIEIEKEFVLSRYFQLTGHQPEKAVSSYKNAITMALKNQDHQLFTDYSLHYATLLMQHKKWEEATSVLTTSFNLSLDINNLSKSLEFSRLLAGLYKTLNKPELEKIWLNQSLLFADSLLKIETSDKLMADKILLLTAQTEQDLNVSKIIMLKNQAIIKVQRTSIVILVISMLATATFLVIVWLQRRRLNETYSALVWRTMNAIEPPKSHPHDTSGNHLNEQSAHLLSQLQDVLKVENLHFDPEISLSALSRKLGTNEKYLSQLFNHHLKVSFTDYINTLRINEACRRFSDPGLKNRSIDQIMWEVGFRSRSTFYTAFKKVTGITPAIFQKNALKKDYSKAEISG